MAQLKKIKIDYDRVKMAIQSGLPLSITTYTLPKEMEEYIDEVLKYFLTQINQSQIFDALSYCSRELINNAKKANTKRIYFLEKKLNINNPQDYEKGMENFKMDTLSNIKYYLEKQRKMGLYIKVSFQTRNGKIKIEIRNKAELTNFEYKRIHDKITRAQMFDTVEQGMMQLLDDSEGAGLGLVIMNLVLRKIGLTEENYQVLSENGETITRMILPFSTELTNQISLLSKDFVTIIDALPEFPDNIHKINQLINDPKSQMSDIALQISNDVSLTAELLKLVNSASFGLSQKCHNISDAVKIVGIRGIRNLLFSIGSMQSLMVDNNEVNKKLWDHAYKAAFYAYNLARNLCAHDRGIIEDSYVCGLLHDMGKIIFETAHPDMLEKIKNMCVQRNTSVEMFEKMVAGVNHGEIGAQIAEKWNFPAIICNVIRYHHAPDEAPEETKKITSLIYLSDMMDHYNQGELAFDQIDSSVLKSFNITSPEQFDGIATRLKNSFQEN